MMKLSVDELNLPKFYKDRLEKFLRKIPFDKASVCSVVLYGSAARGTFVPGKSDVNLLIVLEDSDEEKLRPLVRIFKKLPKFMRCLVMSKQELLSSCDVFPIEYSDMKEARFVLFGEDPVAEIEIKKEDLRKQIEFEARSKLLALRNYYIFSFPAGLARVLRRGFSSLSSLIRAAGRLQEGKPVKIESFEELAEILHQKRFGLKEAFEKLLKAYQEFTEYIDRWSS